MLLSKISPGPPGRETRSADDVHRALHCIARKERVSAAYLGKATNVEMSFKDSERGVRSRGLL